YECILAAKLKFYTSNQSQMKQIASHAFQQLIIHFINSRHKMENSREHSPFL
ncbi:unnamed protein product, partial [Schistosoma curassoni]